MPNTSAICLYTCTPLSLITQIKETSRLGDAFRRLYIQGHSKQMKGQEIRCITFLSGLKHGLGRDQMAAVNETFRSCKVQVGDDTFSPVALDKWSWYMAFQAIVALIQGTPKMVTARVYDDKKCEASNLPAQGMLPSLPPFPLCWTQNK